MTRDYAPTPVPTERSDGAFARVLDFLREDDRQVIDQLLTIPNAVSIASYKAVRYGTRHMGTPKRLQAIIYGRLGDLADGGLARLLDQSTQAGAMIDATLDKVAIAHIMGKAWTCRAAPRDQIATIAATHGINFIATTLAAYRQPHATWRPERAGKYGMALDNLCLLLHIAGYTAEQMLERGDMRQFTPKQLAHASDALHSLGTFAFHAGRPFSVVGSSSYIERAFSGSDASGILGSLGKIAALATACGIPRVIGGVVLRSDESQDSRPPIWRR